MPLSTNTASKHLVDSIMMRFVDTAISRQCHSLSFFYLDNLFDFILSRSNTIT